MRSTGKLYFRQTASHPATEPHRSNAAAYRNNTPDRATTPVHRKEIDTDRGYTRSNGFTSDPACALKDVFIIRGARRADSIFTRRSRNAKWRGGSVAVAVIDGY